MFRLALKTLRFRKGGFVASFIALFLGAAIVMICGGLMETGIAAAVPPHRLAAAPVVVTGNQTYRENSLAERVRLTPDVVSKVQSVPGVARVVPDVSFPATPLKGGEPVAGPDAAGHGWSSAALAPYHLTKGTAPAGPTDVVFDARLAAADGVSVGSTVDLAVAGGSSQFHVVGIAVTNTDGQASLFVTDDEAATLLGRQGVVDNLGVFPVPGTDVSTLAQRVSAAVPADQAIVLTGDDRGKAELPNAGGQADDLVALSAVFGGLAVMVAVFVVASTLGLSVQLRQREMALLRAIGTTPGQLRRMVLGETLVVAIPAAVLGILPSSSAGRWLLGQFANSGMVPSALAYQQSWVVGVSGIGIGLLTALGAALIAARSATKVRPTEALQEASLQRRWLSWARALFAILCLGGGLALTIVTATVMSGPVAASTAAPEAMLWACGIALLAPGITRVLTAALRWPLASFTGMAGRLAMLNASARKIRLAGAITPIMLAVGLATALLYLQTAQGAAAQQEYTSSLRADVVLTSTTGGLPVNVTDQVAAVPGVAAASPFLTSTGFFDVPPPPPPPKGEDPQDAQDGPDEYADSVPLEGVSAAGISKTTAFTVTKGSLNDLTGNTMAIANTYVQPGRDVGDEVKMRLGDNSVVTLKIVAVFTARAGYESVLMPADLLAQHTTTGLTPEILVKAAPNTTIAKLTASLNILAHDHPGLVVADKATVSAAFATQEQTSQWVNYLLVAAIVGYTVISLVNTLVIATAERRREFALQRLIGSTRGQIVRMMTVEAILAAIAGIILGSAVAVITLIPFGIALTGSGAIVGPVSIYLGVILGGLALTLLATLIPTWVALRPRPIEAAAMVS
ncbi:MAG TPA: FtsX-like permease family protein [Pseudonocardiaceae bacterium]|jgi:putative ABC transport system permease protein|nr:FtsX-like permease family protein [Pseudonocardiaceae bacterium]